MTAPVVEVSTKRRTRVPSITPFGPVATASTMSGVGRLAMTVSAWSATAAGEDAAARAARSERLDGLGPRVVHHEPVARLDQAAGHV